MQRKRISRRNAWSKPSRANQSIYIYSGTRIRPRVPSFRPNECKEQKWDGGAAWLSIRKNRNRFVPLIRARSHKMTPSSIEWPSSEAREKKRERQNRPLGNYCSPYTFVHRIGATTNKLVPFSTHYGEKEKEKKKRWGNCRVNRLISRWMFFTFSWNPETFYCLYNIIFSYLSSLARWYRPFFDNMWQIRKIYNWRKRSA